MSKQKRTIALDFDGVLHQYSGWQGDKLNPPIDGARQAVDKLLARVTEVVVFTTRDAALVGTWLAHYDFPPLEVTNVKRPFYCMVDDRAVRFDGTWDKAMLDAITGFHPYWVKEREA